MTRVFERIAGAFHYRIASFADLRGVLDVPVAHWIASACPTTGLACDPRFLELLDADRNGRVHADDLKAAIAWVAKVLAVPDAVVPGSDTLKLAHLAPDAAGLRDTAKWVLRNLGHPDADAVTLAQVREAQAVQKKVSPNGDGIVGPDGLGEAEARLVRDVLAVLPGATDANGERGVDRATVAAFAKAREDALAWADAEPRPWGPDSLAMARAVLAAADRLATYWLQCRLVAANPGAMDKLYPEPDPAALRAALDALPVARPDPAGVLRWSALTRGSGWEAMRGLQRVVEAVRGPGDTLAEADADALVAEARRVAAWDDARAAHPALKLGLDRLREIAPADLDRLDALCVDDAAVGETLRRVGELEKLVLCQRWLYELANNFVAMPWLYDATRTTLFEQGELVMAGRNLRFSTFVADRGAHTALAIQSACFLLYVRVSGEGREFDVCVPVTAGSSEGFFVGKRGVFRTIDGVEHDAVITHMITNPVSIREAVTQPFSRIAGFIEERVQKWAESANAEFDQRVHSGMDQVHAGASATAAAATAPPPAPAPAPPPAPAPGKEPVTGTMLVGAGAIIGSVGAALGALFAQLAGLSVLQLAMGLVGLVALVAAPFALLAWLKLRRRNLAGVLEAGGWALNDRLKLTRQLGLLFTFRPPRPAGSELDWTDKADALAHGRTAEAEEHPKERARRRRRVFWLAFALALLVLLTSGVAGRIVDLVVAAVATP